ncbi:MAG TPA: hypothetical protein VKB47_10290 [Terracidiphilus sp.]|nr:hypothetical protein [Terracidiphilus sp.]
MQIIATCVKSVLLCVPLILLIRVEGSAQQPPPAHVYIPNPTPRPPDLQQEFDDNSKDQKKQDSLSVQGQLRAREVWLESNQILLLAQQLDQEINSSRKTPSMGTSAAKVGQVEKLARSIQEKMNFDQGKARADSAPPEELRETPIEVDTRKLHLLAAELRVEVGKTYKESISVVALKKAAEVEKLAKSLKQEMKEAAAAKN